MIDLEAVIERHLTKDKMESKTFYEGHVVIDLYNCVEEIKRLRGERAAVVAWLREQANSTTVDVLRARDLDAADLIERGEHRKES